MRLPVVLQRSVFTLTFGLNHSPVESKLQKACCVGERVMAVKCG